MVGAVVDVLRTRERGERALHLTGKPGLRGPVPAGEKEERKERCSEGMGHSANLYRDHTARQIGALESKPLQIDRDDDRAGE